MIKIYIFTKTVFFFIKRDIPVVIKRKKLNCQIFKLWKVMLKQIRIPAECYTVICILFFLIIDIGEIKCLCQ